MLNIQNLHIAIGDKPILMRLPSTAQGRGARRHAAERFLKDETMMS